MESKQYKAGFIGCGNMGGTLAAAAAAAVGGANIAVCDLDGTKTQRLADEYGAAPVDIVTLASSCTYIFLGVKPQVMAETAAAAAPALCGRNDFVIVSMAAGLDIAYIRKCLGTDCPVIRIMPNTPCLLGQGMILVSPAENVSSEQLNGLLFILSKAGKLDVIPEKLIDAGSAVSGCGPAYAYMFIEAMADAGVECGLPRARAYTYAAQMLLGSAAMALEKGGSPAPLKDDVCSPGGTTIAGVHALESDGFRAAVMDAVTAAYEKTLKLKK